MSAVVNGILPCLRANIAAYASSGEQRAEPETLQLLLSRQKAHCDPPPPGRPVYSDSDTIVSGVANALRVDVHAPGFGRYNTIAMYDVVYVPGAPPHAERFDLFVTPTPDQPTGLRSYLVTSSGQVHVTTEPRRATTRDPMALACEYDHDVACVR